VSADGGVWVGIDAGKVTHHAAAVDNDGKNDGKVVWSMRVPNTQQAVEKLVERALPTSTQVQWAVDLTSTAAALLLAVLIGRGQPVVYVPGRVVNRMSGAFTGEGKSDAKDARVIAETARLRRDLNQVTEPDELVTELSRLMAHRADLMADWVRGINGLRDLLSSIFPGLERAFDYSTRSALILVSRYCTPHDIRQAGREGLSAHLHAHRAHRPCIPAMVAKAMDAAAAQTLPLAGQATTAGLITAQARKLLDLDHEIKALDKLITSRFRTHPQAAIIESLPGMGPIPGAQFLAATGADLSTAARSSSGPAAGSGSPDPAARLARAPTMPPPNPSTPPLNARPCKEPAIGLMPALPAWRYSDGSPATTPASTRPSATSHRSTTRKQQVA
jgi:transposase